MVPVEAKASAGTRSPSAQRTEKIYRRIISSSIPHERFANEGILGIRVQNLGNNSVLYRRRNAGNEREERADKSGNVRPEEHEKDQQERERKIFNGRAHFSHPSGNKGKEDLRSVERWNGNEI